MPVKPRNTTLESATRRRKLPIRKKPFYQRIATGCQLGYRRNSNGVGSWSVRVHRGGIAWLKKIGDADDLEAADGEHVLSFWQAVSKARELARPDHGMHGADSSAAQLTVRDAIDLYSSDLQARGGEEYNAQWLRVRVPPVL